MNHSKYPPHIGVVWGACIMTALCVTLLIVTLTTPTQISAQGTTGSVDLLASPIHYPTAVRYLTEQNPDGQAIRLTASSDEPLTPAELKLLPSAWQKEYAQLKIQVMKFKATEEKLKAEVQKMYNCEIGCPGGGSQITCPKEDPSTCIAHDACIKRCDKGYASLKKRIDTLNKQEAAFAKKVEAFIKKVNAYKAKNPQKFKAPEGTAR